MFSRLVALIGLMLALWMSAGRWLFGIGGDLTLWYLPTIGLVYAWVHVWIAKRIALTRSQGRSVGRGTIVSLILSWLSAIAFGITVPDRHDGGLETIISLYAGDLARELAIALCNPLGIVAFATAGFAVGFAISESRDPRPEEDEFDEGPQRIAPHPLSE